MGYGHRYWREAEPQMAAPPWTDPIEHRATRSRPTQSADGNVALRGVGSTELPLRPPRWPLTGCAFSWKRHRGGILEGEGVVAAGKSTIPRGLDRGDGQGVGCGDYEGHSRVLQALRLSTSGPTSMTAALGGELLWEATGYVVCVTILL